MVMGDDDGDCNYCRLFGVLAGGAINPHNSGSNAAKREFCNSTNYPVVGRPDRAIPFRCPLALYSPDRLRMIDVSGKMRQINVQYSVQTNKSTAVVVSSHPVEEEEKCDLMKAFLGSCGCGWWERVA